MSAAQRRLAAARVLVIGAGGLGSAVVPILAGIRRRHDRHRRRRRRRALEPAPPAESRRRRPRPAEGRLARRRRRRDRPRVPGRAPSAAADRGEPSATSSPTTTSSSTAATTSRRGTSRTTPRCSRACRSCGDRSCASTGRSGLSWHAHGADLPRPVPRAAVSRRGRSRANSAACCRASARRSAPLMAGEVVKLVTGVGEPLLGRVTHDRRALRRAPARSPTRRIADAPEITTLIDYELFCGLVPDAAGDAPTPPQRHPRPPPSRLPTCSSASRRRRAAAAARRARARRGRDRDASAAACSCRSATSPPVPSPRRSSATRRSSSTASATCARAARRDCCVERGHADVVYLVGGIDAFAAVADELVHR